ncbi:hypothetical protein GCM10009543_22180 [Leifsonia naganoensis]
MLTAAASDDAALNDATVQAGQVKHVVAVAAAAEAARVAAEQAAARAAEEAAAQAAAQAAAEAAAQQAAQEAAQQATQRQTASQQSTADDPVPSGPIKCPAGSQANSGDGGNDTSCLPEICFHITLPDPNHTECETPFKP